MHPIHEAVQNALGDAPDPMTPKVVRMPDALWAEIADYRFRERIGTEAAAVRRLVALGLSAAKQQAHKKVPSDVA